jgi:hypothetical protein
MRFLSRFLFVSLIGLTLATAGVPAEAPQAVESGKRYVFYMHGAWIETHGLDQAHPHHGPYQYDRIVGALSRKGYEVISEVRTSEVPMGPYADWVVDQVVSLIENGVPPENITVLGHSKGGLMTLIVASRVGERKINYVVMAGCGRKETTFRRGYERFLDRDARNLRGRILSIYDADDREAGSCQEAFNEAARAETKETILHTGRGHGLFYAPESSWIEKVAEWVGR